MQLDKSLNMWMYHITGFLQIIVVSVLYQRDHRNLNKIWLDPSLCEIGILMMNGDTSQQMLFVKTYKWDNDNGIFLTRKPHLDKLIF